MVKLSRQIIPGMLTEASRIREFEGIGIKGERSNRDRTDRSYWKGKKNDDENSTGSAKDTRMDRPRKDTSEL
jgi:hypothetical protein